VSAVAEPGRNSVDRNLARDQVVLERARALDALRRLWGERTASAAAGEMHRGGDRQRPSVEVQAKPGVMHDIRHAHLLQPRLCPRRYSSARCAQLDPAICSVPLIHRAHLLCMLTSGIDELDARILGLPAAEPRVGIMEASRRLGAARGTVHARLATLEQQGVVGGYGPEVDPARMGYPVLAFVFLHLTQGRLAEAVAVLEEVPQVLEASATSGPSDLLCRVVARDTERLQEIVNRPLSNATIRRSTSYVAPSQQIRTALLVEAAPSG
jgi:DNA-binding Lrp family transcriptional regulator